MATVAGSALRPERFPFKNGMVLLHNRAAANPSVVVRALVRAGASRETPGEHGIAGLTGRMLRQGTQNITKAALAEELDGMGAGLSVDIGYALVAVSIKCLSGDFARAVEILTEVLRRPTFPADELDRLKGQVLTELKEMDDNTRVVSERTWRELAYPATHPYHRLTVGNAETVGAATRDDLSAYQTAWYGPNQTILMVVGDVAFDEAAAAVDKNFGDWPGVRIEPVESTLPASDLPARQQREVAMVGKTQAAGAGRRGDELAGQSAAPGRDERGRGGGDERDRAVRSWARLSRALPRYRARAHPRAGDGGRPALDRSRAPGERDRRPAAHRLSDGAARRPGQ